MLVPSGRSLHVRLERFGCTPPPDRSGDRLKPLGLLHRPGCFVGRHGWSPARLSPRRPFLVGVDGGLPAAIASAGARADLLPARDSVGATPGQRVPSTLRGHIRNVTEAPGCPQVGGFCRSGVVRLRDQHGLTTKLPFSRCPGPLRGLRAFGYQPQGPPSLADQLVMKTTLFLAVLYDVTMVAVFWRVADLLTA